MFSRALFGRLRAPPRPHSRPASTGADPSSRPSLLSSYISTLRTRYPNADPASLIASFLILHELTAILPLGLGFWGLKSLGVGERAVDWALAEDATGAEEGWGKAEVRKWIGEGEEQAERIGRRYGVLGYDKETREERDLRKSLAKAEDGETVKSVKAYHATGDVANLAAAYVAVKVLLPARILLSIRLAPPLANIIVRRFKKLRDVGARYLRKAT
ncbi:hypothetical protein RQP46_004219 [Phenoliferia psychrophenolica]